MSRAARVWALARFRVQGAVRSSSLVAPVATLLLVESVLLTGDGPPGLLVATAVLLAFPVVAWAGRQVLDATPDGQFELDAVAVGSRSRADIAGLVAAYAVALVLVGACAGWGLLVDAARPDAGLVGASVFLSAGGAAAAVAVASLASRAGASAGGLPVLVLVAAPLLTVTLGQSTSPWVTALVPRLFSALRAAENGQLPGSAAALAAQMVLWAAVVLGGQLRLRH